jgi:hypothetical protein
VCVLDHGDRRRLSAKLAEERAGESESIVATQLLEIACAGCIRELAQRAQRDGYRQRLTRPHQERRPPLDKGAKRPHQRALADPRLAANKDECPRPSTAPSTAATSVASSSPRSKSGSTRPILMTSDSPRE